MPISHIVNIEKNILTEMLTPYVNKEEEIHEAQRNQISNYANHGTNVNNYYISDMVAKAVIVVKFFILHFLNFLYFVIYIEKDI